MDLTKFENLRTKIKRQNRYIAQIEQFRICLNDSPRLIKDLENYKGYLADLKALTRLLIDNAEPDPALNQILKGYYVDLLDIREIAQRVKMTQKQVKECLEKGKKED